MPERTGATVPDELWDRVFRAIDRADALPEDRRARAIRDALADSPEALALADHIELRDGDAVPQARQQHGR